MLAAHVARPVVAMVAAHVDLAGRAALRLEVEKRAFVERRDGALTGAVIATRIGSTTLVIAIPHPDQTNEPARWYAEPAFGWLTRPEGLFEDEPGGLRWPPVVTNWTRAARKAAVGAVHVLAGHRDVNEPLPNVMIHVTANALKRLGIDAATAAVAGLVAAVEDFAFLRDRIPDALPLAPEARRAFVAQRLGAAGVRRADPARRIRPAWPLLTSSYLSDFRDRDRSRRT